MSRRATRAGGAWSAQFGGGDRGRQPVAERRGGGRGEQCRGATPAPCPPLPAPSDDIVRSPPGAAFLVLARVAPVPPGRQFGCPRVAQARLPLGHRGGLAARASDARRSLG